MFRKRKTEKPLLLLVKSLSYYAFVCKHLKHLLKHQVSKDVHDISIKCLKISFVH